MIVQCTLVLASSTQCKHVYTNAFIVAACSQHVLASKLLLACRCVCVVWLAKYTRVTDNMLARHT